MLATACGVHNGDMAANSEMQQITGCELGLIGKMQSLVFIQFLHALNLFVSILLRRLCCGQVKLKRASQPLAT